MTRRWLCAWLLLIVPAAAMAEEPPSSRAFRYSPYEEASIRIAAERLGASIDPDPEGKAIDGIDVVSLDVIEPRDPAPGFLNVFHSTTRPYVLDREVLMEPGQPFRRVLCDETARNLRRLPQLSLVVCAAVGAKEPGHVRVLVVTKDVWSLRLNNEILYTVGGGLENLLLEPTETNLAGTHQTMLLRYHYQPESHAFGAGYRIPRLVGTRIALTADATVVFNRRTGDAEGTIGSLIAGQPLYSARTEWAWAVGTSWRDEIYRQYSQAREKLYPAAAGPVPWEYRTRRLVDAASVTRSFGWAIKNDLTFGAEMNVAAYRPPDGPGIAAAAIDEFAQQKMPVSDTRAGPFVQYRGYTSNFVRVLDFETLGLQEDYRLGHEVWLRLYPVTKALGSSRDFLGTYLAAQYTVALGDGLARASAESTVEAEAHRLSDAAYEAAVRIVTPRLGFGRFVVDASTLRRYRNHLNVTSSLGGGGRLRGYPTSYLSGEDLAVLNVEFRSRPVEILSCQLGGAVFFDVGDAFDDTARVRPKSAAGVGLRILFPQLNRVVLRADLAVPFTPPQPPAQIDPVAVVVSFEQAFPVPAIGGRAAGRVANELVPPEDRLGPATSGYLGQ